MFFFQISRFCLHFSDLEQMTHKTGNFKKFDVFVDMLHTVLTEVSCFAWMLKMWCWNIVEFSAYSEILEDAADLKKCAEQWNRNIKHASRDNDFLKCISWCLIFSISFAARMPLCSKWIVELFFQRTSEELQCFLPSDEKKQKKTQRFRRMKVRSTVGAQKNWTLLSWVDLKFTWTQFCLLCISQSKARLGNCEIALHLVENFVPAIWRGQHRLKFFPKDN